MIYLAGYLINHEYMSKNIVRFGILLFFSFCWHFTEGISQGYERFRNSIILTEQAQSRIIIANIESNSIVWEWTPYDSGIAPEHIGWFNNPSDAKVVYDGDYKDDLAIKLLAEGKIKVRHFNHRPE